MKLYDIHHLLDYVDDVNIMGGSVHTVKENTDALLVNIKELGLEVNAGRSHSIKIDNSSLKGWKSSNIWE